MTAISLLRMLLQAKFKVFFVVYLSYSIDASKEDGTLGRLVNDDHVHPNCKGKRIMVNGRPHLCLFAVREIFPGEEITYNYGVVDGQLGHCRHVHICT